MNIANGEVEYLNGTDFNAVTIFSCSDGYELVGDDTATCLDSGSWNKTADCIKLGETKSICYILI